jgi:hypothetical protein
MSSEEEKNKKKEGEQGQQEGQGVTIKIDRSEEMKGLQTQLEKVQEDLRKKEEILKTKETELESVKKEKEEIVTEKDHFKTELETIAEKEWAKTKTSIKEKATSLFNGDEAKVKEIMAKLEDPEKGPENLSMTEYMLKTLEDTINKGRDDDRKAKEAEAAKAKAEADAKAKGTPPAGGTPLTGTQMGDQPPADAYDNEIAMIRDLHRRERDPKDPTKQAEAKAILDELFKKWITAVKKDFEGKQRFAAEDEKQKDVQRYQKEGA